MKHLLLIASMDHHHLVNGMRMCILLAEEKSLQVSVGLDISTSWTLRQFHYDFQFQI